MIESNRLICGDCLEALKKFPDNCVDLVFTSPPYEDCRTYGIDFKLKGQEWVDWLIPIISECSRVCKGLVAFVVQGKTRNFRWSATPALLIADLHRKNFFLRNPPLYNRSGIPGQGGPDWLRSDYEWIICISNGGKLPWSDNTAMGHPPKCKPGGDPTNRKKNGERGRLTDGGMRYSNSKRRKHGYTINKIKIANPGNIIRCSGGHTGSKHAHENEAPFPEKLAEFFIRSFCPPQGIALDPFMGSGTTCAVAKKNGRNYIGIDIRQSQIELTTRRLNDV